jgi:tRNA-splicing ligase RtcB
MKSYTDIASARAAVVRQGDAEWLLPINGRKPVKMIANDAIFAAFDDKVFEQAVNTAEAPGVEQVIVNPDAHAGYGCPVGSVVVTNGYMYPGPVGPDICCSMSYLQTDVPDEAIADKRVRREILNAIGQRIPTGMGSRQASKARSVAWEDLREVPIWGAHPDLLTRLGIPSAWGECLEQAFHGNVSALAARYESLDPRVREKLKQIGSLGGGNHFSECQATTIAPGMEALAAQWGIHHGKVGFLTHCGSRGFGYQLAARHFKGLEAHFARWGIPLPGGERELVYAPVDSPEGQAYMVDMYLGANFATVNHLLINAYLLEAIREILPGAKAHLVYHISHNIGREEIVDNAKRWVFRKGATRAFPAGHHDLKGTPYAETGHPILLPGNPEAGSYIMVGLPGSEKTCHSINHGAGRAMGRNHAKRTLIQRDVDAQMLAADILYNGRSYPLDEAPGAYKPFEAVTQSIEQAGLAKVVAKLRARFVVKDGDQSAEGAA